MSILDIARRPPWGEHLSYINIDLMNGQGIQFVIDEVGHLYIQTRSPEHPGPKVVTADDPFLHNGYREVHLPRGHFFQYSEPSASDGMISIVGDYINRPVVSLYDKAPSGTCTVRIANMYPLHILYSSSEWVSFRNCIVLVVRP